MLAHKKKAAPQVGVTLKPKLSFCHPMVLPISGSERLAAAQNAAFRPVTVRVLRTAALATLDARCRMIVEGSTFDITTISELDRRTLEIGGVANGNDRIS